MSAKSVSNWCSTCDPQNATKKYKQRISYKENKNVINIITIVYVIMSILNNNNNKAVPLMECSGTNICWEKRQ
jgi:hypothetical protein